MSEVTEQPAINVTTQPVETPKPETPIDPVKPEEKKTPEFMSDKFAALSKKEKAIVRARQELNAQKAQLEQERTASSKEMAEFKRWQQLKDNAKLDPDAYLQEAGLSYGSLTERNLKGGIDPQAILDKANQTIENFKKEQAEREKKAQESNQTQAQKDYEARVTQFVEGIHDFVEQNKETYELTAQTGQQNLIWDVIKAAAQRGQELSVKQSAERVENYLAEKVEAALSTKRFKDKFTPVVKTEEPAQPGTPTLTNSMTGTTTPVSGRMISEKERIQNAMNVLSKFD